MYRDTHRVNRCNVPDMYGAGMAASRLLAVR